MEVRTSLCANKHSCRIGLAMLSSGEPEDGQGLPAVRKVMRWTHSSIHERIKKWAVGSAVSCRARQCP
eukprot:1160548-Pelagomonas_calceolata.AAC.11